MTQCRSLFACVRPTLRSRGGDAIGGGLRVAHLGGARDKLPQLEQVLAGQFSAHQRCLIAPQLAHSDFLDTSLARISAEIAERLYPVAPTQERLQTIPEVGQFTAEMLVAEIGVNLTRFPSVGHLASWAGLWPGNDESAGKRRSGRTHTGSPRLRTALVEAARVVARSNDTYLAAQHRRLAARCGAKRAAVAVAHTLVVMVYTLLTLRCIYQELGYQ